MKIDLISNSSLISTIDVSFNLMPKFYSAASGPFSQILSMTIHLTDSHTCHHTDTATFSLGTYALFPASFLAPTSDEFTTGLRSLRKCCPLPFPASIACLRPPHSLGAEIGDSYTNICALPDRQVFHLELVEGQSFLREQMLLCLVHLRLSACSIIEENYKAPVPQADHLSACSNKAPVPQADHQQCWDPE